MNSANKPLTKVGSRFSADKGSDDDYEDDQWDKNAADEDVDN